VEGGVGRGSVLGYRRVYPNKYEEFRAQTLQKAASVQGLETGKI
jgi:hypothetical protein